MCKITILRQGRDSIATVIPAAAETKKANLAVSLFVRLVTALWVQAAKR
jgi:hypothetical protein